MVPWPAKIAAKIVISRIPISRVLLNRLGMFRHGANAEAAYAYGVYLKHHDLVRPAPGFTCLELGPGDALASAPLTRAFGGAKSYQVDVAPFARESIEIYRAITQYSDSKGRPAPALDAARTLGEVLQLCNGQYLTEGLASLRAIPSASVDFLYSQAVLEHVRLAEFRESIRETRRVLKSTGAASHEIDFRDHLAEGLNNLRFSDAVWESALMADSGFYTNRISYSEMMSIFQESGFGVEVVDVQRWDRPPIARSKLSRRFRQRSDDELSTSSCLVLCRPA